MLIPRCWPRRPLAVRGRAGWPCGGSCSPAPSRSAFLVGNPYALLDARAFQDGLSQQSGATGGDGKLGAPTSGFAYYAGRSPGASAGCRRGRARRAVRCLRDRRLALVLVPGPVLFLLFMGLQVRFFGRWLLPIYPFRACSPAYGRGRGARRGSRAPARPRLAWATVAAVVLLAPRASSTASTSTACSPARHPRAARDWMTANLPPGTKVVIEPVVPDAWSRTRDAILGSTSNGRWTKCPTTRPRRTPTDAGRAASAVVGIEDYERTLRPS